MSVRVLRAMKSCPAHIVTLLAVLLTACGAAHDDSLMSGYAEAELVYVAAATSGPLKSIAARRGDSVRRGQALFEVEPQADALGVDVALARQQRAEFQAANLRKGRRPAELKAADEQLAQAQAALQASASALQRQQQLVAQGFIAAVRLDELQAARDRDAARVRELQAQRVVAGDAARSDEIAAAAAEARGARGELDTAVWRLGQRQGAAPVDGVVFDVLYRPGEWAGTGTPVVALLPKGALKLKFFVPQRALARTAIGTTVALLCDGCPAGLSAQVRWVSPQAEYTPPVIYSNASRDKLVFAVEAVPDDAARSVLKPGQPVDVRLPAAKAAP
jgi:HlyD family secretion protein